MGKMKNGIWQNGYCVQNPRPLFGNGYIEWTYGIQNTTENKTAKYSPDIYERHTIAKAANECYNIYEDECTLFLYCSICQWYKEVKI